MRNAALAVLAVCVGSGDALAIPGADLVPHRAYYSIALKDATWGSNIAALQGKLVVEFNDSCDGYTLNQRFVTELTDSEGNVMVSDLWLTSWEAADGQSFRFDMKNEVGGQVVESYRGRATSSEEGGQVDYEGPQSDVSLPKGTLFPTRHSFDLVNAALADERSLSRLVFDGSDEGEIYRAYATIGLPQMPEQSRSRLSGVDGAAAQPDMRSWPVVLSYFKINADDALPDYEISFMMYENGLSSDLIMRYENFSVTGELQKVELLDRPRCR